MKPASELTDKYKELRNKTLAQSWRKLGFSATEKHANVWGVLMEIGYPQTVVTLVCLVDGSVSFYMGNGDAILGGGKHESVRMRAEEFILIAETLLKKLNKTKNFPLPEINRIRFYALTYSGIFTTQVNRQIDSETHEFFPLFQAAHEVIAALRAIDEQKPLERISLRDVPGSKLQP